MRTPSCFRILSVAGVVAVVATQAWARPTVSGVRHAVKDQKTRVVIDLSQPARYEIRRFENPERLAINIPNVRLSHSLKTVAFGDGLVRRVRFNRLSWGSQVVLDLRHRGSWFDFYLAPMDGMPYRIVVDVEVPGGTGVAKHSSPVRARAIHVPTPRPYVIAIDAGHGGHDPGAARGRLVEKTAALDIARRLESKLDAKKGYASFLTRDRDVFLSLPRRTEIAAEKGADIFVSIHLNSAPNGRARGSEVYFLSPAGAEATASRFLHNRNKAVRELGLQGGSDDILHMLVDVNQQSMLERSSLLAEEVLKTMHKSSGVPSARSIKQRSFAVLKSITMPSVLVETGFVTNSHDAKVLSSRTGRENIASAIAEGVVSFLEKYPPPKNDSGRILVHRVQKGDTLWKISRQYNTTVASIQKSNRLGSSQVIRVGQELVIREKNETY
jgi:N-acetylmuramoyl-L-alanine amidase